MPAAADSVHNLSSLLDVLQKKIDGDRGRGPHAISVEETLRLVGRRAYGPLLLIIGLLSISPAAMIPGSTWAFALLTLLIALQMAFLRPTPWLPKSALAMQLSERKLEKFIDGARPIARFFDKGLKARLTFLADAPWVIVIALLCVLAALITFPLGLIPLAPFAPGLAIALFGLGLTARDGLVLLIGGGLIGVGFWLLATRLTGWL